MEIEVVVNTKIDIQSAKLDHILKEFIKIIQPVFESVVIQVLHHFARKYIEDGTLAQLLGCKKVTWKTSKGAAITSILTIFGKIYIPQLQIKNHDTGKRIYISRILLGILPRIRVPEITKKILGLMGALAPLRVVNKFLSLFSGTKVSLMTIVRSIRDTAKNIEFDIDEKATNEFEGDGTGIPIINAGKRGRELEVLAQRKKNGGIRIAGMTISKYKKGWEKLFEPLKESLKKFGSIFLVTDGDTSPLDGLKGITVILQRCLFHIPHEIKYTLWEDKVKRKTETWIHVLSKIYRITKVKRIYDDDNILKNILKGKRNQLSRLINYCIKRDLNKTARFLMNAKKDIFTGVEKRISGGTTSLIERVMRTVNQRINVAKWSTESALAVAKLRGAYYYNGFDV